MENENKRLLIEAQKKYLTEVLEMEPGDERNHTLQSAIQVGDLLKDCEEVEAKAADLREQRLNDRIQKADSIKLEQKKLDESKKQFKVAIGATLGLQFCATLYNAWQMALNRDLERDHYFKTNALRSFRKYAPEELRSFLQFIKIR